MRIAPSLEALLKFKINPQPFTLKVDYFLGALKLRTRVAVAQRIELFIDCGDGCGFDSHQSHASSEALGFSHLEPLSLCPVHHDFTQWLGKWPFEGEPAFLK